jgi:hypothetical protein
MPRMQAIWEQQDEQVRSILTEIDAAERKPEHPYYPAPEQLWECIAALSDHIPWGHISIEPAMLTQGALGMDQHRLYRNISEVPQLTTELLLSIPPLLAAFMTAIGETLPEFWETGQEELFKGLKSQTTWTLWLANALDSANNRRLTGKFDSVTPQPMYVVMRKYKDAGFAISKITIHLPMQLLFRIVKNWEVASSELHAKDFCPAIPNVKFFLKEPRHATLQLPLLVCHQMMPSAPVLHRLIIGETWRAACQSIHREWGLYSLLNLDHADTTIEIPVNIWLDEPKAVDMAHVSGEARHASFMNQLENATETTADEAASALQKVIQLWEVQEDGMLTLLKDDANATRLEADVNKTPPIPWEELQPFLFDASGQTLTKIQEQRAAKKKNRGEQQGKGAKGTKRGKTGR